MLLHCAHAHVQNHLVLGQQHLLQVGLEPPLYEEMEDLVQLPDEIFLGLVVVDVQIEPVFELVDINKHVSFCSKR